jgi:hypothetical protein
VKLGILDLCGLGRRPVVVSCEHGNEISGFMIGGGFIDRSSDYQLLEKDSAPCSP